MMTIITNDIPRPITYGYELTDKQRAEFDYIDWTQEESGFHGFVTYKGATYDLDEFQSSYGLPQFNELCKWDGFHNDSFFSGIVIRYMSDTEYVVMGTFIC